MFLEMYCYFALRLPKLIAIFVPLYPLPISQYYQILNIIIVTRNIRTKIQMFAGGSNIQRTPAPRGYNVKTIVIEQKSYWKMITGGALYFGIQSISRSKEPSSFVFPCTASVPSRLPVEQYCKCSTLFLLRLFKNYYLPLQTS